VATRKGNRNSPSIPRNNIMIMEITNAIGEFLYSTRENELDSQ
jgi:hypothetical protein